jgi:hypothetical protein
MTVYNVANWYWIVGGDETQVYASARAATVPTTDATYQACLAAGVMPTRIDSMDNLKDVLRAAGAPLPFEPLTYAAAKRLDKETSGITVGGVPIATDDRSKIMIIGARVAAAADPNWSTPWAAADGNSYPVDSPTMLAIADAVQAHVNTCFTTYANVVAAIGDGTITTKEQIDAAFA